MAFFSVKKWARATRGGMCIAAVAGAMAMAGCGWLAGGYERQHGRAVEGEYKDLANRTAVVVVYVPPDLLNEYPMAPLEISNWLAAELAKTVPTLRLVNPRDVITWQNNTVGADKLMDKDIAKHWNVDRVIAIEVIEYRTKEPGIEGYVRGRIDSTVRVTEGESGKVAYRKQLGAVWPPDAPADMMRVSETEARRKVLELYARNLAYAFYDHREKDPSMHERRLP